MENKRELMGKFLKNKEADRVPFSFWHHMASPPGPRKDLFRALEDEEVYDRVIQGHIKMYETMQPDFMKLMSDGFFGHPGLRKIEVNSAEDLYKLEPIGENHPWIVKQVDFVNQLNSLFHDDVYTFYTIFSPINSIRLHFQSFEGDPEKFPRLFLENPEAMAYAAEIIAKDTNILIEKIYEQVNIDGLYYSVQEIQDDRADKAFHEKYVHPTDLNVITTIKKFSDNNILHICGYKEYTNDLSLFTKYDLNIINWATYTEQISLREGRKLFKDKIVLGGFNNNLGTVLDSGTDEEIAEHIKNLISENGTKGIILGADCTVNPDISSERYQLIKDCLIKYSKSDEGKLF